ncbi:MAG: putative membrane protein [Parasphingorhabdus sp.]|jgi:uncharacterized membrane protein
MSILVTGLIIFFLIHAVPMFPAMKGGVKSRLGENGYKGLFSVISLLSLGLIIWGKSVAPFEPVWQEPLLPRTVSYLLVLMAFILLPAANMPTNIKRFTRHPMLWGIVCWALAHLNVNGDKASILLFGGFLVYSIVAMISSNARGATYSQQVQPVKKDIVVVVAGITVYAVVFYFHGSLFGYPLG